MHFTVVVGLPPEEPAPPTPWSDPDPPFFTVAHCAASFGCLIALLLTPAQSFLSIRTNRAGRLCPPPSPPWRRHLPDDDEDDVTEGTEAIAATTDIGLGSRERCESCDGHRR